MVAAGVAGLTILVGLAPDPPAFLRSTIGNLADIAFRPDTQSLPGLVDSLRPSIEPTQHRLDSGWARSDHPLGKVFIDDVWLHHPAGLGLGAAFVLGMAFPNYWFLVAGLLALGTVLEPADAGMMHPGQSEIVDSSQGSRQEMRIAGV